MRAKFVAAFAVCVSIVAGASAEEAALDEAALEAIASGSAANRAAAQRSWLFNDPATTMAPGDAFASVRATYGGNSLTRPFAGNLSTSGAMVEAGAEMGLTARLSAVAIGAREQDGNDSARTGAILGLRWSALPASSRHTQLVLSGGVLRELGGSAGGWARLSVGHDEGRARFVASIHGERIFASGHDSIDMMVTAGANVRLLESVRAGIEYVGQDLEGAFGDESEGGARHIVGATFSAALIGDRMSIVAGPAVALGSAQTHVMGRVALGCRF